MTKQDLLENQAKFSYLAIGSNLGNKVTNIEKAKTELLNNKIEIIKCSSNFESESWPNPLNPKFINIVIKIKTNISPLKLLETCQLIEKKLGRKKKSKNSPRTCDIDIISYNQRILTGNITIPHKRMHRRNFVLIPLFELNKNWFHPKTNENIKKLIFSLSIKDIRSIKQI